MKGDFILKKLKEIKKIANWHINHLTEGILDYIDDDEIKNIDIINSLKEEREHWRDILRIINGGNTYIDYKNY